MDYLFYSPESKLFGITIFLAIFSFQMAFILWQWFYEKRIDYLYYLAYMFVTVCYGLSEFEQFFSFKIFSHITNNFDYYTCHFLPLISVFFYYRFARAFLNLPVTRPKLNVYVVWLEYFILTLAITSLFMSITGVSWIIIEYTFLIATSIILVASSIIIANFLKNSTPLSRFAMLGAGCLLMGSAITIILLVFESFGYKLYMDPFLPLLFFVIAEILVFTTGLIFKSRLIEKQKLEAEQALLAEYKHRQQVELQMYKMRENISRDLHDEIGSGLSKISLLGEVIRKSSGEEEPRIGKIIESAKEMMQGMSEMVWSLNSKNDMLADFIYYLRRYTNEFFDESEIVTEINIFDDIPEKSISGLQRRNILMAYKEILNNILKHSKANHIKVLIRSTNQDLTISVHDNGIGIPEMDGLRKGNGLTNMESRMKDINGRCLISNSNGTLVQLEINLEENHIEEDFQLN